MKRMALFLALAAVPLHGQRIPESAITISLENVFTDFGEGTLPIFMLRHTAMGQGNGGAGVEFSFAFPMAMPIPVALEIGPAVTAGRGALLHFRAGVSLIVLMIPGVYVGGGITLPFSENAGLRLDATHRVFFGNGESASLSSIGIGLSFFPGRTERAAPCDCERDGERP